MDKNQHGNPLAQNTKLYSSCQACGLPLERGRRRYCNRKCKEELIFKLKWFNNLLRVIRANYATFTFTDAFLVLNVIPNCSGQVFTYFYGRIPGNKPARDMNGMVFQLGEMWWDQIEKTRSQRYASRYLLDKGRKNIFAYDKVKPLQIKSAGNVSRQMACLQLTHEELLDESLAEVAVKSAFRRAALKCHPDIGGDAEMFRKTYNAYLDLLQWVKNPSYQHRRGVPGQWSYIAGRSSWITPL